MSGENPRVQGDNRGSRLHTVTRGPAGSPQITADYDYYPDGQVSRVTHGNGTAVEYEYDAANRITRIEHRNAAGVLELGLVYTYATNRDLPTLIEEFDVNGQTASVLYHYDDRGRLYGEFRVDAENAYDIEYRYDQGGNRTKKVATDYLTGTSVETRYEYDVDDVPTYGTATNRLMKYETFDTTGGGQTLLSTTYYFYNDVGNPTRVVTELAAPGGQPKYSATVMNYATNGQAVTHAMHETWNDSGTGVIDYTQSYGREFRYDGARQRYMEGALNAGMGVIESQTNWTDYDGDDAYSTFKINMGQLVRTHSWEPGLARVQSPGMLNASADYFHTDHLGTTRFMSTDTSDVFEPVAYSAFGEQVSGVD